jgi:peptidoglycan/xylan/chitin deacetylase (PgdA/CDA1 family)
VRQASAGITLGHARGIRLRLVVERAADVILRHSGVLAMARRLDARDGPVLRVVLYHRVVDPSADPIGGDPNIISATPQAFAEQMRLLARHYAPVDAADLEMSLRGGPPLPPRGVLVTFDDGYRDFATHAWPALKAAGVPVILFVPTAYPGRPRLFWWDEVWQMLERSTRREVAIPGAGRVELRTRRDRLALMAALRQRMRPMAPKALRDLMAELRELLGVTVDPVPTVLSWHDLRRLAREGVTIASHGRDHGSMPALTDQEVVDDIEGSQADLQRELGTRPTIFSYPFGHYDPRAAAVLRARGFAVAFATGGGRNPLPLDDAFAMRRQSVNLEHSLSRVQLGLAGLYPAPLLRVSSARPRGS